MLRNAMGAEIAAALDDPDVVEILLNTDGSLWLERLSTGRAPTGASLSPAAAASIICLVAAHARVKVNSGAPILSAELPAGEHFYGVLPPAVRAPTFSIRKRPLCITPLAQYVRDGVLTQGQRDCLCDALHRRRNIVIAGRTGVGKTTLANTLLDELAETGDRVAILQHSVELKYRGADQVSMRAETGVSSMAELVATALRLGADRVVLDEVRGPEAVDVLLAWRSKCPGGMTTIDAGSVRGALTRLEQLIQEAAGPLARALIAEAVNLVVFMTGRTPYRSAAQIVRVMGHGAHGYELRAEPLDAAAPSSPLQD